MRSSPPVSAPTSVAMATMMMMMMLSTVAVVEAIKVLRSDMTLEQEGQFLTGAKLINDVGNVTVG